VYYHTAGVKNQKVTPHGSLYAPSFYSSDKNVSTFRRTMKDITPPILVRGFRKLQKAK
jgi:hypothetical protein